MNIHPIKTIKTIKTEQDYQKTLHEIEGFMMAKANTTKGGRLDVLVTLVEDYERKYYPLDFPEPIEAIKIAL